MNWESIWMTLFGRTTLGGLDMGFWVSMIVVAIIVVLMNVVFWNLKPKKNKNRNKNRCAPLQIWG